MPAAAALSWPVMILVLVLCGCGQASTTPTGEPPRTLAESLVFSGDVSGHLDEALDPQPGVSVYPRDGSEPPRITRCATYFIGEPSGYSDHLYEADIVGIVGGVRYGLYLKVEELGLTPVPGVFQLTLGAYSQGDAALMTADGNVNTTWYRTTGIAMPSSFTVNSDQRSGTVDVSLARGPHGSLVHIAGSWRCE